MGTVTAEGPNPAHAGLGNILLQKTFILVLK